MGTIPQTGNQLTLNQPKSGQSDPPYSGSLTKALRALPSSLDRYSATDVLQKHLAFARKIVKNSPQSTLSNVLGWVGVGNSTRDITDAENRVLDDVENNGIKKVQNWPSIVSYPRATDQYNFVVGQIGKIYGAISSLTDEVAVVQNAANELPQDLAKSAAEVGKGIVDWGKWVVPLVAVAVIVVYFGVLRSK
jgi:hypothetical protein